MTAFSISARNSVRRRALALKRRARQATTQAEAGIAMFEYVILAAVIGAAALTIAGLITGVLQTYMARII